MSDSIKLKKSLFGFGKHSVLQYINSVSKNVDDKLFLKDNEIKKLKNTIEELNLKITSLNQTINDFEEEKKKISDLYIHAEETSANIVKDAEANAAKLLDEANEKIRIEKEKFALERENKLTELSNELEAKKAVISGYKAEIRSLKEKIKITLTSFDDILSDTIK